MVIYEVYGLEDWEPFALACKSCASHVLSVVPHAYSVISLDAPQACELNYETLCEEREGIA